MDACQAAGAVPFDVVGDCVDLLAAGSHKFLLGSRGMGYLYVRRELIDRMRPILPGWKAGRAGLDGDLSAIRNVVASVRAGNVRLAVHFHNLEDELDRVADLMEGK